MNKVLTTLDLWHYLLAFLPLLSLKFKFKVNLLTANIDNYAFTWNVDIMNRDISLCPAPVTIIVVLQNFAAFVRVYLLHHLHSTKSTCMMNDERNYENWICEVRDVGAWWWWELEEANEFTIVALQTLTHYSWWVEIQDYSLRHRCSSVGRA